MIRGYTTIEQSKKLLSLGLKPNTADMYYEPLNGNPIRYAVIPNVGKHGNWGMPAWSLAVLLDLMPVTIRNCQITIDKEGDVYNISYDDIISGEIAILYADCCLIDASFKMVVWLIEQGYIKVNDY